MSFGDFLLFVMHEDPGMLGLLIFAVFALVLSLPVLIFVRSRGNHDQRHQFHSELMCNYCRARTDAAKTVGEAYTRWPLRMMGERPPRGTG